ncbi:type II toxin-antitoxin system VapC family toxin [Actinokineospora sp.]|uniref:type II toxin-antitoxin system VapC family toxin n=1 Tax=Actinokineospora sp. TaxID=1872133 RepID=UPI004038222D
MIVLDACVLIAHLDARDAHHERATRLLATTGDIPLRVSALTMAEVLVGPILTGRYAQVQQAIDRLGVVALDLPATDAVALATMRAHTGLKMPDAIVLLTAQTNGAVLCTFDEQLARLAGARDVVVRAAG